MKKEYKENKRGFAIMTAIPGWAYLVLGVVMMLASKLINAKTETNSLTAFFYVGILFVIIGVGKYIYNAIFRKKQPQQAKPAHQQAAHHRAQHSQHRQQAHHPYSNTPIDQPFIIQSNQPASPAQPAHHWPVHLQGQHTIQGMNNQPVQQLAKHAQHPSIIACPSCSTRHYDYANYCMRCGTKMRK